MEAGDLHVTTDVAHSVSRDMGSKGASGWLGVGARDGSKQKSGGDADSNHVVRMSALLESGCR